MHGRRVTGRVRPAARAGAVALVAVVVTWAGACGESSGSGEPVPATGSHPSTTAGPGARRTTTTAPVVTAPPVVTAAPATTAPTTTAAPPPVAPAGPTVVVTHVVDGDTLWVAGNVKVRLIGIDTPERGQCGYAEATATLRSLVDGRDVVLVPGARDDSDRYGRLLRYVEVAGVDANLAMIRSGRAIARYDSRDGYGRHAREDAYVAADAATPSANVCGGGTPGASAPPAPPSTAAPVQPAGPAPAGATDPRFGTCGEAIANGYGHYVRGVDPEYGWYRDADGDGTACE